MMQVWRIFLSLLSMAHLAVFAEAQPIRLITLDPGHFHAALVQKDKYPNVDSTVYVYAPPGPDVQWHLERIKGYNARTENPTAWREVVYTGADFQEKMLAERRGNVVVMAGNNRLKTAYITDAVAKGFHVLADKPMAIDVAGFELLKKAFATAAQNKVLLYDIMTERYEITSMLQRAFSMQPAAFGKLLKGSPQQPAIVKESVHHFYKNVSGKPLVRPAWFMDVTQQGEGIVDVTTHLVDLTQWAAFPEQIIDYQKDIQILKARRWTTDLSLSDFESVTQLKQFPDYLQKDVQNGVLKVYSNGEIVYRLKGVHAKVAVTWAYKAPAGGGDTHYSIMRGTKADLVIRQGAEQGYKPVLYIEPKKSGAQYEQQLQAALAQVQRAFPGISLEKQGMGWRVAVPKHYDEGHEAHFGRVAAQYFSFLDKGKLPAWEVPNMLAKYYVTTRALDMAKGPTPPMSLRKDGGAILIERQGKPLWRYQYATAYPPAGVDSAYQRSGFVHPVYTPHGQILTRIQPPDHYHHYGVWNPWTKLAFEGDTVDCWNLKERQGTVQHIGILSTKQGTDFAEYAVAHDHIQFKNGQERVMLHEVQTTRVHPIANDQYWADITIDLRTATVSPVWIVQYRYAGLGWRTTADWDNQNSTVLTSEGRTRKNADGSTARWCVVQGQLGSDHGGIVMLSHPANYNHPEPLRIWPEDQYQRGDLFAMFAPTKNKDWLLEPNKTYTLRYRFVVFNGKFDAAQAEAAWRTYATAK